MINILRMETFLLFRRKNGWTSAPLKSEQQQEILVPILQQNWKKPQQSFRKITRPSLKVWKKSYFRVRFLKLRSAKILNKNKINLRTRFIMRKPISTFLTATKIEIMRVSSHFPTTKMRLNLPIHNSRSKIMYPKSRKRKNWRSLADNLQNPLSAVKIKN